MQHTNRKGNEILQSLKEWKATEGGGKCERVGDGGAVAEGYGCWLVREARDAGSFGVFFHSSVFVSALLRLLLFSRLGWLADARLPKLVSVSKVWNEQAPLGYGYCTKKNPWLYFATHSGIYDFSTFLLDLFQKSGLFVSWQKWYKFLTFI